MTPPPSTLFNHALNVSGEAALRITDSARSCAAPAHASERSSHLGDRGVSWIDPLFVVSEAQRRPDWIFAKERRVRAGRDCAKKVASAGKTKRTLVKKCCLHR